PEGYHHTSRHNLPSVSITHHAVFTNSLISIPTWTCLVVIVRADHSVDKLRLELVHFRKFRTQSSESARTP
ncbi:hypothetical protein BaRGS_00038979, partial [Batillaria attramentaria]